MIRKKLQQLVDDVDDKLQNFGDRARISHNEAAEVARSAYNSPSQSGDRFHAEGEAQIAFEAIDNLKKLKEELQKSGDVVGKKIKKPCFILLKTDSGGEEEIYLVENSAKIRGYKLVSVDSPLGKELLDKQVGEKIRLENKQLTIVKIL